MICSPEILTKPKLQQNHAVAVHVYFLQLSKVADANDFEMSQHQEVAFLKEDAMFVERSTFRDVVLQWSGRQVEIILD